MHSIETLRRVDVESVADDAAARQKRRIQSVERALSLLEFLAESDEPVRLNRIAAAIGLNTSTCHHLLATLMDRGYVAQKHQSHAYHLGGRILELCGARLSRFDLAAATGEAMRRLNEATGETVHLAALQDGDLITLMMLDSRHPVRVVTGGPGKSSAIHATAIGKAILAWLPESEMDRILTAKGMSRFTEHTLVTRDDLIEDLRHARRNGFATDNEEYQPGVVCIGAAIRNHTGAVIGSFSCSLPTMRAAASHIDAIRGAVIETASCVTASLGGDLNVRPAPPSGDQPVERATERRA